MLPKSIRDRYVDQSSIEKLLRCQRGGSNKICVFPNATENSLLAWNYKKQDSYLSSKYQGQVNWCWKINNYWKNYNMEDFVVFRNTMSTSWTNRLTKEVRKRWLDWGIQSKKYSWVCILGALLPMKIPGWIIMKSLRLMKDREKIALTEDKSNQRQHKDEPCCLENECAH